MEDEMIFGIRAVIEAVQAGKEIDRLLIKKDMQGESQKSSLPPSRVWTFQSREYPWSVLTASPARTTRA